MATRKLKKPKQILKKQTRPGASTAAAKILAMVKKGYQFWSAQPFRGSIVLEKDMTILVARAAGSALSNDETPKKKRL
jgi:hypothetical protein